MPSTGLGTSYPLRDEEIDNRVEKDRIGVYVLGYAKEGSFYPQYVGRSDTCLKTRVKQHAAKAKYKRFKFRYYSTIRGAFEKECTVWHDFDYLQRNQQHPDRPDDTTYPCPAEGCDVLE